MSRGRGRREFNLPGIFTSTVSWPAILAGAVLALAICFLLAILGGAVGVSVKDRVDPNKLQTGAFIKHR